MAQLSMANNSLEIARSFSMIIKISRMAEGHRSDILILKYV